MRRIIAREVRQNFDHALKITDLYNMINLAIKVEFFEDNAVTRQDFCVECFTKSLEEVDGVVTYTYKTVGIKHDRRM